MLKVSPKYKVHLMDEISESLWNEYKSYSKVYVYIKDWHTKEYYNDFDYTENFTIEFKDKDNTQIDVLRTLSNMDGELILKMAIDLGIETPDYIPSIPTFRNKLKDHYQNASLIFERAFMQVENDPALSIGLANSALESIIKDACVSLNVEGYREHSTLTELMKIMMKKFRESNQEFPEEIKQIANNMNSVAKCIEDLRSDKTVFHGKSSGSEIVEDSSYAYFIVNTVATIGLFVINYQKRHIKQVGCEDYLDLPF